jgi:hypothetical protein
MENLNDNYKHIKGWGIDADDKNEPTWPMKKYTGDDHQRLNYERPVQQPTTVEILHSNERPGVSAVFGTSVPPSGVSGMIRRYSFQKSEASFGHWIPLIIADRVNVIEGIIDDFKKGIIPNIFAEKGFKAEWKYNRAGAVKKIVIGVAVMATVVMLLRRKRKSV